VARIQIVEPNPDLRELLALVVERLGHTPVLTGDRSSSVDLLVAEPATQGALELALALRAESSSLPIVVVSFLPQPTAWTALAPAAYVLKPFTVPQLEAAIADALAAPTTSAA